jgi:hypothetical protein
VIAVIAWTVPEWNRYSDQALPRAAFLQPDMLSLGGHPSSRSNGAGASGLSARIRPGTAYPPAAKSSSTRRSPQEGAGRPSSAATSRLLSTNPLNGLHGPPLQSHGDEITTRPGGVPSLCGLAIDGA